MLNEERQRTFADLVLHSAVLGFVQESCMMRDGTRGSRLLARHTIMRVRTRGRSILLDFGAKATPKFRPADGRRKRKRDCKELNKSDSQHERKERRCRVHDGKLEKRRKPESNRVAGCKSQLMECLSRCAASVGTGKAGEGGLDLHVGPAGVV